MGVGVGAQVHDRGGKAQSRLSDIVAGALSNAGPPLLFGFRLWASVCLALFISFYLELPNSSWAGASAAIMCQPPLGAALRKGWFLMVGTAAGAIMIVALTAFFPQDRVGFLVILTLWCGLCAYLASELKNFVSYGAALAGYTPLIVAANVLGATGGPSDQVFMVAVTRASEICIGIVSAGIVLAGTDFGTARRRLAKSIAGLASGITGGFAAMLRAAHTRAAFLEAQAQRREFIRRIVGLDPMVDQAIGESSELRYNLTILQTTVCGLFAATDGWRTIAAHLLQISEDDARAEATAILSGLPAELRNSTGPDNMGRWLADPEGLRQDCDAARQALLAHVSATPAERLICDQTVVFLNGIISVLGGLALLVDAPGRSTPTGRNFALTSPDRAPSFVNAARAMLAVGSAALFWVITAWPSGTLAMTFVAIAVLLLSPRGDQAPAAAVGFALGSMVAIPFAAIVKFAVLPNFETFFAFCLVFGLYLVPVGVGVAQLQRPALSGTSIVMGFLFVFLLDPENQITYDTLAFYNSALAIFAGCAAAWLAFALIPPLPPALRARRLVESALADVRSAAIGAAPPEAADLRERMYSRLAALPDKGPPACSTRLLAAMTVGSDVTRLRTLKPSLTSGPELDAALASLAAGNSQDAITQFTALDHRLATMSGQSAPDFSAILQARAAILVIIETIKQHLTYFAGAKS